MSTTFQQSLSSHVARLTNNGESIATFLNDAMEDVSGEFSPNLRVQAARILARFSPSPKVMEYLRQHDNKPSARNRAVGQPQVSDFRLHYAHLVQEATGDGLTIVQCLIDVMQGRNPSVETGLTPFKPQHRMAAVRELIKIGCCQPTLISEAQPANGTVIPAKAGIHGQRDAGQGSPLPQGEGQGEGDPTEGEIQDLDDRTPEERENDARVIAKHIKRVKEKIANMTEEELNPPLKYEPNYEMWDQIGLGTPPPPGFDMSEAIDRMNDTIARQKKALAAKAREKQRNDNDLDDYG